MLEEGFYLYVREDGTEWRSTTTYKEASSFGSPTA